ncbi:MAG: 3-dehydroquinate synthase [Phycisphaerae bacterium]|nr:3-dehydroquinate synthase [Phycisphaerae bacterium]
MARRVMVELPHCRYPIAIGAGAISEWASLVSASGASPAGVFVVADASVAELHRGRISQVVGDKSLTTVAPGETSKSLEEAERLYQALGAARVGRDGVIVAIGGGVVGDLAGFVAGTWMRGIRFLQVPTTLEAAIDAAVGGKTGVNTSHGKNMVGVFHQPIGVIVDLDFLATLADRDLRAGLAESVKHAAIRDPGFLEWQETNAGAILRRDAATLGELIARNVAIKADVVSRDEREAGLREILNYGHTVGHAIEHLMGYELRHGECVALGMIAENEIAVGRGWLGREGAERIRALIAALGLPTRLPTRLDPADIWAACRHDKKNRGGAVRMVVLRGVGAATAIADATEAELTRVIEAVMPLP